MVAQWQQVVHPLILQVHGNPAAERAGGAGAPNTITGSDVTYAGGGGGGNEDQPVTTGGAGGGGNGGGGPSSNTATTNGTANTGGGGGGGGCGSAPSGVYSGGSGGSGVVIVKEEAIDIPKSAPGVWSMNTVYDFVKNDNWVCSSLIYFSNRWIQLQKVVIIKFIHLHRQDHLTFQQLLVNLLQIQ